MVASEFRLLGGSMTRRSVREYIGALHARHGQTSRQEKGRILDEFTQGNGYHRKATVRLLRPGSMGCFGSASTSSRR
jgi:hypothetical protein